MTLRSLRGVGVRHRPRRRARRRRGGGDARRRPPPRRPGPARGPAARAMGLLRSGGTPGTIAAHPILRTLAGQVRRTGVRREVELDLPRGRAGGTQAPLGLHLRAVALNATHIAVEAADVTESHRLARVRRVFVANVSHELKTPIGVVYPGPRGPTVYGNDSQIATAVTNLVENAIAYSGEDTTVSLTMRADDDWIEIDVADQGIGIAPHDVDRIFERFYRADQARSRSTGGTGLGLAIVKHIATNHGGRVDVTSTLGAGSTFTLRLPARPPEAPLPLPAAALDIESGAAGR